MNMSLVKINIAIKLFQIYMPSLSSHLFCRYRKKNLYLEPEFKPGVESDETAIFVTDFGVAFTLQVMLSFVSVFL